MIPHFFKLQWHITNRCNFRCSHCYQEDYGDKEMSLEQMGLVLDKYVALLKKWQIPRSRAFLTITGGEPFVRRDFFQFLAKVYKKSQFFSWSILSNGSFITRETIKILRLFNSGGCQVSLEGLEEANDKIRGKGSFKKAIEAIKLLVDEGIGAAVSLTFTKNNIKDVFPLARLLAKTGVYRFFIRRLIPLGTGGQMKDVLVDSATFFNFYKRIDDLARRLYREKYKMIISFGCESSLFKMEIESEPRSFLYQCPAEYCALVKGTIMALLPNGDILSCRRLPIVVGNILNEDFEKIYNSPVMKDLRNMSKLPMQCRNCPDFEGCLGGARCISYAFNDCRLDFPDPQCRYAAQTL